MNIFYFWVRIGDRFISESPLAIVLFLSPPWPSFHFWVRPGHRLISESVLAIVLFLTPAHSPSGSIPWSDTTASAWPALALNLGLPWPRWWSTLAQDFRSPWASTQKFQAGIMQYSQFAVDTGTVLLNSRPKLNPPRAPYQLKCYCGALSTSCYNMRLGFLLLNFVKYYFAADIFTDAPLTLKVSVKWTLRLEASGKNFIQIQV